MSAFIEKLKIKMKNIDDNVNKSFIGKIFDMPNRNATLSSEWRGASATFLAMAYILAVNPRILADSGGPCVAPDGNIFSEEYEACLEEVKRQYVTATAIASMIGCVLMGFLSNLPVGLSCGMGMNAYFTYTVVGWRGTGSVPFNAAVTAVLIEGIIFAVLALTGARFFLIKLIPDPIRHATPAGIGCFLAHIGLQTAEGIGLVVGDIATAVTLGGCPPEKRTPLVALTDSCKENIYTCVVSDNYTCDNLGGVMTSATMWVGILGLVIIAALLTYQKKSAFIIGISFITVISWFRNSLITYFPDTDAGNARFEYFSKVVSLEPVNLLLFNFTGDLRTVAEALITFLYIDFLDTSGTLLGLATSMKVIDDKTGDFPRSRWAFTADALATIIGSFFSLSPVTSFIESGAGVQAGAKTGLASVICGFYFFLSIFFAPLIASIPPWATGGALVIIGSLMVQSLTKVQWHKVHHAITAFVTVILMPLTYSIGYALIGGIMIWVLMQLIFKFMKLVFKIEKPYFEEDAPEITSAVDKIEDIAEKKVDEETSSDGVVKVDVEENK